MALRAPFRDDEGEGERHDDAGQRGAGAPVGCDAVGAVIGGRLEVHVSTLAAPTRGHAITRAVRAEGLRQHDVDQPDSVGDLHRAEDDEFEAVTAGEALPRLEETSGVLPCRRRPSDGRRA